MNATWIRRVLCAATWGLAPVALAAQSPLSLSVAGGATLPRGDLGTRADLGWHAMAAIGLDWWMQPWSFRIDGGYNRMATASAVAAGGTQSVIMATVNLSYRIPSAGSAMAPYAITGLGAYRNDCSAAAACVKGTHLGFNAGLGTRFYALPLRGFLEARFHYAGRRVSYFPVTIGFTL